MENRRIRRRVSLTLGSTFCSLTVGAELEADIRDDEDLEGVRKKISKELRRQVLDEMNEARVDDPRLRSILDGAERNLKQAEQQRAAAAAPATPYAGSVPPPPPPPPPGRAA